MRQVACRGAATTYRKGWRTFAPALVSTAHAAVWVLREPSIARLHTVQRCIVVESQLIAHNPFQSPCLPHARANLAADTAQRVVAIVVKAHAVQAVVKYRRCHDVKVVGSACRLKAVYLAPVTSHRVDVGVCQLGKGAHGGHGDGANRPLRPGHPASVVITLRRTRKRKLLRCCGVGTDRTGCGVLEISTDPKAPTVPKCSPIPKPTL